MRSSSPRPSYALTPCPHQLTYALLFIQAVRYNFWGMGAQLQQEGCYDLDKVIEKNIYSQTETETREASLLPPPVHNHIFVLSFRVDKKREFSNGWRKFMRHLEWMFLMKTNLFFWSSFKCGLAVSFPLYASEREIIGDGRWILVDWGVGRSTLAPRLTGGC